MAVQRDCGCASDPPSPARLPGSTSDWRVSQALLVSTLLPDEEPHPRVPRSATRRDGAFGGPDDRDQLRSKSVLAGNQSRQQSRPPSRSPCPTPTAGWYGSSGTSSPSLIVHGTRSRREGDRRSAARQPTLPSRSTGVTASARIQSSVSTRSLVEGMPPHRRRVTEDREQAVGVAEVQLAECQRSVSEHVHRRGTPTPPLMAPPAGS